MICGNKLSSPNEVRPSPSLGYFNPHNGKCHINHLHCSRARHLFVFQSQELSANTHRVNAKLQNLKAQLLEESRIRPDKTQASQLQEIPAHFQQEAFSYDYQLRLKATAASEGDRLRLRLFPLASPILLLVV